MLVSPVRESLERKCEAIIEMLEYEEAPSEAVFFAKKELCEYEPDFGFLYDRIKAIVLYSSRRRINLGHFRKLVDEAWNELKRLERAEHEEFGKL